MAQRKRPGVQAPWASLVAAALLLSACSGARPPATNPETLDVPDSSEAADATAFEPEPTSDAGQATPISPVATDPNDFGTDRPSSVTMSISGADFDDANGSYGASGMTRWCGDFQFATSGNLRGFDYGFPHDIPPPAKPQIEDVTFSAPDLLPGASTASFYLSVGVVSAAGQEPPSVVIQPGTIDGDSGTAQRTESGGTTTLTVDATNDFGEHVTLTATCGPRAG
jgi:hypothetical protein